VPASKEEVLESLDYSCNKERQNNYTYRHISIKII
jgi:hypothetical protein